MSGRRLESIIPKILVPRMDQSLVENLISCRHENQFNLSSIYRTVPDTTRDTFVTISNNTIQRYLVMEGRIHGAETVNNNKVELVTRPVY